MTLPPEIPGHSGTPEQAGAAGSDGEPGPVSDPYSEARRAGPPDRAKPPSRWRRGRDVTDSAVRSAAAARAVGARQRLPGGVPEEVDPPRPPSSVPGLAALGRAALGQRQGEAGEQAALSDVRPFRVVQSYPGSGVRPAPSSGAGAGSSPRPEREGSNSVRKVFPSVGGDQSGDGAGGLPAPLGGVKPRPNPTARLGGGARTGASFGGAGGAGPALRGSAGGAATAPRSGEGNAGAALRGDSFGESDTGSGGDPLVSLGSSDGGPEALGTLAGGRLVDSAGSYSGALGGQRGPQAALSNFGQGSAEQRFPGRGGPAKASRRSRREPSWDTPTLLSGWRKGLAALLVVVLLAGVYVGVQVARGVPRPGLRVALQSRVVIPGAPPSLPFPKNAESEVTVSGVGSFGPSGPTSPIPIGSVAKVMTAYIILKDHPLSLGQQGPSIPVTAAAVSNYQADELQGDSVVPVTAGQSLTELQALQALLIPSGDNIAVLLADWDAKTQSAFVTKMNATAAKLGMDHTTYADAAGLSGNTKSTPGDQLILAPLIMANPTFASIVGMTQVDLPTAGVYTNYNTLLGTDGVIGIKTGSVTTGDLLFAAKHTVMGKSETIYGAVLGVTPTASQAQGLIAAAISDSQRLLTKVESDVRPYTVLRSGSVQARVAAPWLTSTVPVATASPLSLLGWPGLKVSLSVTRSGALDRSVPAGTVVGRITAQVGAQKASAKLRTTETIPKPTLAWRLTRL